MLRNSSLNHLKTKIHGYLDLVSNQQLSIYSTDIAINRVDFLEQFSTSIDG